MANIVMSGEHLVRINLLSDNFTMAVALDTQKNYNFRSHAIVLGWDQVKPINAVITIIASAVIGSTSVTLPAFDISDSYPAGGTIEIINNGSIIASGGGGG